MLRLPLTSLKVRGALIGGAIGAFQGFGLGLARATPLGFPDDYEYFAISFFLFGPPLLMVVQVPFLRRGIGLWAFNLLNRYFDVFYLFCGFSIAYAFMTVTVALWSFQELLPHQLAMVEAAIAAGLGFYVARLIFNRYVYKDGPSPTPSGAGV